MRKLFLSVIFFMGCGKTNISAPGTVPTSQGATLSPTVAMSPATADQCPSGGMAYSLYLDQNGNGQVDAGEKVLSTQVVCNGQTEANGLTTRFSFERVTTDTSICASASGVQLHSGLDRNQNEILEPSEIDQSQILCDGKSGSAGTNGLGVVYQTTAATTCAAGGTLILIALDVHGSGVYAADDLNPQAMTLCNGDPAPVTAYSPVAAIEPCGATVSAKEVLLRLANGQVLASFSDSASGLNTRLSFIADGTYEDTDASGCTFSLATSADGKTRSVSWFGQMQLSWPVR